MDEKYSILKREKNVKWAGLSSSFLFTFERSAKLYKKGTFSHDV